MPESHPCLIELSLDRARRLAVSGQRLLQPPAGIGSRELVRVVREIGYLQRDPLAVVAPSHLLVLWSRLGGFDRAVLERALWEERSLFEYWAHGASIVPTADYQIHRWSMTRYGRGQTLRERRLRDWVQANRGLRRRILARLAAEGPLPAGAFEVEGAVAERSHGWSEGSRVEQMLHHLWREGRVAVAGRDGRGRHWALAERWLDRPEPAPAISARELAAQVAERSLHALGVATELQIRDYMGAGGYQRLDGVLERLVKQGRVVPVRIVGPSGSLPGRWYSHQEDLADLDGAVAGPPRAVLLSPFDNLISLRGRARTLFDFDFKMELYVPPPLRRFGYYVLPILHGERLIGRIDLRRVAASSRLLAQAVHAEPSAPDSAAVGGAVRSALEGLAAFLGVAEVEVASTVSVPRPWLRSLRS